MVGQYVTGSTGCSMITQDKIIDAVAGLAPWLAPVPTAYLIGRATAQHLEWPIWVAVAGAIVVECIGLTVANQALVLYNYNQDKRKSDPRAPLWLAILLVIVYLAVAVILTVLLDTLPDVAMYAPVIFPLLSLTGVTALALRADHQRRMRAIQAEKDERRQSKKQDVTPVVTAVTIGDQVRNLYVTEPGLPVTDAATRLHTSRKTVYKHLRRLRDQGVVR
jgi:hypothetical protein